MSYNADFYRLNVHKFKQPKKQNIVDVAQVFHSPKVAGIWEVGFFAVVAWQMLLRSKFIAARSTDALSDIYMGFFSN